MEKTIIIEPGDKIIIQQDSHYNDAPKVTIEYHENEEWSVDVTEGEVDTLIV